MNFVDMRPRQRINGINLDALDEMVDGVRKEPCCGALGFKVTTEWKGQVRSETRVDAFTHGEESVPRSFTIVSDEPKELLGEDSGPNPQELLLAAVNACMMVGYVVQAALRGITLQSCRIETDCGLDMRGFLGLDATIPPGCRRINYTVYLDGDGTREQYEEIHQVVMSTSPNYFNAAQPVQMHGRIG